LDAGPQACAAGWKSTLAGAEACAPVGWSSACPSGFEPDPSGPGCLDVQPAGDCPAGTLPTLGSRDCQPVGVAACAAGFTADPSGWGCLPVLPATPCTGATLEVLGQATCQPLGDCAAAFPPPGATHFVDAAFTDLQLDATHFRTLTAALSAAPAGAVIAVESGTYLESVTLSRAVTLAGRCAAQVVLDGAGGSSVGLTVGADSAVRGVTVRDQLWGAVVLEGARLQLTDALLDANRGIGLRVEGSAALTHTVVRGTLRDLGKLGHGVVASYGGKVALDGCVVSGNGTVGVDVVRSSLTGVKSEASVVRSVVQGTLAKTDGSLGVGLEAVAAKLLVRESAVRGNQNAGVSAAEASAEVIVEDSVLGQTACGDVQCAEARALTNAALTVRRSTLAAGGGDGLLAQSGGAATLSASFVRGAAACAGAWVCAGVEAVADGQLEVSGSAVVGGPNAGLVVSASHAHLVASLVREAGTAAGASGVQVERSGVLTVEDSALVANRGVGLRLVEGSVTGSGLVVSATRPAAAGHGSSGISVQALGVLSLTRAAVTANAGWGLHVAGRAAVAQTVVRDTAPEPSGQYGRGVQVDSGGGLTLSDSLLLRNREVALLVLEPDSYANVTRSDVRDTQANQAGLFGYGAVAQAAARLLLEATALTNNRVVGIGAFAQDTHVSAHASLVSATLQEAGGRPGEGVIGLAGASLQLDDTQVRGTDGVGLMLSGASASVARCIVESNLVGLHVTNGSTLSEGTGAAGPLEVVVDAATLFVDNQTRLGSGPVPLPPMPGL
jgi:hypothetical protein